MNTKLQFVLLLHFLLRFIVLFLAPIACLFMQKTDRRTSHYGQDPSMQRYRLPKILSFMETPDEDLAGGMYEPTVKNIYDKFGAYLCSVYWIGFRNQSQGLLWRYGKEVDEDFYRDHKKWNNGESVSHIYYEWKNDNGLNEITWNLGLFKVVFGWEICHDHYLSHTKTGYYAIPDISFTK